MTIFSIVVCVLVGSIMLFASTISADGETWAHRVVQLVAGLALIVVALHVGGILP